jgi:signal transduction histidine kinase
VGKGIDPNQSGGKKVGIRVTRTSKDETRVELCREILSELFGTECALVAWVSGYADPTEALYVWDFMSAENAIPQDLEPPKSSKQWFVIHRKDLHALKEAVGTANLHGLLKPVTRGALGAFLAGACHQQNEQNDESAAVADGLRVQRDDMLQLLVQSNLKLQQTDHERNNFLARSVHDFRAPLTAISGYCGLLMEEEFGPLTPEQHRVLGKMRHSATRLSRVCNAMFQLSALRHVDQGLNLEKADIRDCLDQALHEVAPVLEDKRISITAEFEPAPYGLLFEKSQITQALVNLLDNACRFTPRDGTIEMRGYPFFWERRAGQGASPSQTFDRRVNQVKVFNSFRLDIRDSGPGIPAVHVDRIFDEFTSCSGGQDRSGGGLGLAICRMILQGHQGCIWAESNASGTMFSFVVPLQQMPARLSEGDSSLEAACQTDTVEY